MKRCLNCLEYIDNDATVCPYCGAKNDAGEGYVLLSEVKAPERKYLDVSSGKKNKRTAFIVISVIILAVVAAVSYYYFNSVSNPVNPPLSFTSGTGVINDDQRVIYVAIKDSSKVEYIQSVSLYKGDVTESGTEKAELLSTDYEYTDNVDDSFRTIFFYADDLDVEAGNDYTYTFKINLSFIKDDNVYAYTVVNSFDGDIKKDASDIIFDHSLKKEETTIAYDATTVDLSSSDYIFDGYWYTMPEKTDDGTYRITAIRFEKDSNACTYTHYSTKKLEGDWDVTTSDGTYEINNGILTYSESDLKYVINTKKENLLENKKSAKRSQLTRMNYNNVSNAHSLFL